MFPTLQDHQTWLLRLIEIYDSKHPDQNQTLVTSLVTDSSENPTGSNCLDDIKSYEPCFIFEVEAEECLQYFIKNQVLHYPLSIQEMHLDS